jgi:hypothetical protein
MALHVDVNVRFAILMKLMELVVLSPLPTVE